MTRVPPAVQRLVTALLAAGVLGALAAQPAWAQDSDGVDSILRVGEDVVITSGERIDGDVTVLAADLVVEEGGEIGGNANVVFGDLRVDGVVDGDVTASNLIWKYQRSIPQLPSAVLYEGVLYMVNDGGILTTLDPATGAVHKQARVRGEADSFFASPVAGDGKVYFVSRNCRITAIAGAQQEVVGKGQIDGDECFATPAIAGGRVYLRTKSALYAFARR